MKKILLGTTALVGAALVSQAALADGPKVTVGGTSEFEAGMIGDDQSGGFGTGTSASHAGLDNRAFYSRNEISFKVDGKSDAGLGYGGEVWLTADTSADQNARGVQATRTFLFLDGMWGRFEGGSNYGADQTLKVDASTIARATGGIAGDWAFFANNRSGNPFIATPDLPINYDIAGSSNGCSFGCAHTTGLGDQGEENLNKLTYYTPKWNGFQAGLSFAPNDVSTGQITTTVNHVHTANPVGPSGTQFTVSPVNNIWQGGVNWSGNWDQVGIVLAGTAERGEAITDGYNNLWAWQGGAKVSYMGFSVAGSYANWGDSLRLKGDRASDSKFWTLGGAYEYGPYGVSLTYLHSTLKGGLESTFNSGHGGSDSFHNWVIGTDYKLAPGLTPYAELSFYDQNAVGTGITQDNSGHVFLVGTQLNF